jgi:glycosyltransferase involved in cell wall biosynthesis
MKILFVVASYKPAYIYGGPVVVIALLAESLVKLGHDVTVYTTTANGDLELDVKVGQPVLLDGVSVYYFKRLTKDHTHVSPALFKKLNDTVRSFDIVHLHGWWNLLIIGAALVCKIKNVKPVLSPHGMFSNYILGTNHGSVKTLTQFLIGKKLLKNTFLHVSTEMEWKESQYIISNWSGEIIPNLVTLSDRPYEKQTNKILKIGFLSRIDPKKGLDLLIRALANVNFQFTLQIAGAGDEKYVNYLKNLSEELGISSALEWVGWKNGEEKFSFLAGLDIFALTSHSENFAIVIIESLSVGTPVLISDQVGLHRYVEEMNYGWVTDMAENSVSAWLDKIDSQKDGLADIGRRASVEVRESYDSLSLAQKYVDFYTRNFQNKVI